MVPTNELLLFAGAAFLMVLSPGPNMLYLISRSICQGRKAGIISLLGVVAGFFVHMLAAAVGLTALLLVVPLAYEVLKWMGAAYLLWLAWQAVRPDARSPFAARDLPPDSALNPPVAMFYLSVLPQFVAPERGSVFLQSIAFGCTQIAISFSVNLLIALFAAGMASWFTRNPAWLAAQRYVMGFVLAALAVRLVFAQRRI